MGLEMQSRKHIYGPEIVNVSHDFCYLLSLRSEQILIQVHEDIIYLHDELLQQKQLFSLHWFKIMAWSKWIYSNSEHPES